MTKIEEIRQDRDQKLRTIHKLNEELNRLSEDLEKVIGENKVLRNMANLPDKFGIDLE